MHSASISLLPQMMVLLQLWQFLTSKTLVFFLPLLVRRPHASPLGNGIVPMPLHTCVYLCIVRAHMFRCIGVLFVL